MQIRFGQVCELSIDFIRSVFHWLFLRGKVRSDARLAQHKNCVYWVNMRMKARIWEMTEVCRLEVMFLDLCHGCPSNLYMFFGWAYPFLRFYVPFACYRFLDFYFCLLFLLKVSLIFFNEYLTFNMSKWNPPLKPSLSYVSEWYIIHLFSCSNRRHFSISYTCVS